MATKKPPRRITINRIDVRFYGGAGVWYGGEHLPTGTIFYFGDPIPQTEAGKLEVIRQLEAIIGKERKRR
jgi:hypothetical protein